MDNHGRRTTRTDICFNEAKRTSRGDSPSTRRSTTKFSRSSTTRMERTRATMTTATRRRSSTTKMTKTIAGVISSTSCTFQRHRKATQAPHDGSHCTEKNQGSGCFGNNGNGQRSSKGAGNLKRESIVDRKNTNCTVCGGKGHWQRGPGCRGVAASRSWCTVGAYRSARIAGKLWAFGVDLRNKFGRVSRLTLDDDASVGAQWAAVTAGLGLGGLARRSPTAFVALCMTMADLQRIRFPSLSLERVPDDPAPEVVLRSVLDSIRAGVAAPQKARSTVIDRAVFEAVLLSPSTPHHFRARLQLVGDAGADDWLHSSGGTMGSELFRFALTRWLRVPLLEDAAGCPVCGVCLSMRRRPRLAVHFAPQCAGRAGGKRDAGSPARPAGRRGATIRVPARRPRSCGGLGGRVGGERQGRTGHLVSL